MIFPRAMWKKLKTPQAKGVRSTPLRHEVLKFRVLELEILKNGQKVTAVGG